MILENVYVTADPHFGHKNIIEYEIRPFNSVEDMEKKLISNWNKVINNKSKIFVLGDFSFLGKEETKRVISNLNGRKILVLGNHDRAHSLMWWYDAGFDEVYKYPIVINEYLIMSHEPPQYTPPNTPYLYIYGHVHSSEMYKTITKTSCCVSLERWGYSPVPIKTIIDKVLTFRQEN